ncbi:hypothetical protein KJ877_06755 [bacterium]|nr:hypothetical protein [bacterium]MBU1991342.1 hypothetical protein [bacterium]
MILSPEVLTIFILNALFAFFALIAFYLSIKIFLNWNYNSVSELQYRLEKQSFLAATIIKFIFLIKVPLFLFFIFTLDKISNVITGAMCGAGVVNATDYGTYLIVLKILNLYFFAYWIVLHNEDMKNENQPYTRRKFGIFIVAFLLLTAEIILEGIMFNAIDLQEIVDCCGAIYSSAANSYISNIFSLKTPLMLSLFYGNFLLILIFYFLRYRYLFAVANVVFIIVSLISLISFFGTYIYELPTHHCPFCFLQKEYHYTGYFIYIFLFIGTFYAIVVGFINSSLRDLERNFTVSLLFNLLYVILLSSYPVLFYIKNGVWL